jgi:hypothetical protein
MSDVTVEPEVQPKRRTYKVEVTENPTINWEEQGRALAITIAKSTHDPLVLVEFLNESSAT